MGLSAAATFLTVFKTPLFVVGIAMNVVGVLVIGRRLWRVRRAHASMEAATGLLSETS